MTFEWTRSAIKQFGNLPTVAQRRIATKMRFFERQVDPLSFAKSLVDSRLGTHRFRVGDYRIVVERARKRILVVKVAKRDQVYD